MTLLALTFFHTAADGRTVWHAMPIMLGVLSILAIAYAVYSRFLAFRVVQLDDQRVTPAHRLDDSQNYHPTNKWVAFGHHFAAISGAGPLIGPVLAIQYGYMPGLIWLVIGVCLAGAVQDMLVLAASVRRDGKSLAEIAKAELGRPAAIIASIAILFIVVIALAGLGFVVVKALGGEEAKLPAGMVVTSPEAYRESSEHIYEFPAGCKIQYAAGQTDIARSERFTIRSAEPPALQAGPAGSFTYRFAKASTQLIPGSSWGTFTIVCTIPIAVFVGIIMKRWKNAGVLVGSVLGGLLTLAAVVAGHWIPGSALEPFFSLTKTQTVWALVTYGFIAAVLPVWLLLGPRDYLSSFMKIGTVALLIGSVIVANPPLNAPPMNEVFATGGPTFKGNLFPFVFICVMCGAISGFHALVSSGTTPKMIDKESHVRRIGYGAMLMEAIVGVTALIAAAALPSSLYYDINVPLDQASDPALLQKLNEVQQKYGTDKLNAVGVDNLTHLNLGQVEEKVGGESLRGRTGGAVTLAVGMSVVFEDAFRWLGVQGDWLLKYWYHFAIMFEALFILTTIDAGTRIGRFLLQETLGRVFKPFAKTDWLPGAMISSAIITGSWGWLISTGSIDTIWPMFGIANQLLSVLALSLVTTWLVNTGRGKYAFVTILPMLWVMSTTLTAAKILVLERFPQVIEAGRAAVAAATNDVAAQSAGQQKILSGYLNIALTLFVVSSVMALFFWSLARWLAVAIKAVPTRKE
ncbi:MAG: carbon starvation protein A [Gemmataceae bacterium]